ncbi:MAG: substrate-binding domain-containing protein [Lachnospiraceae bacterium]|nr:substrate-binding domain-containing protein [Lachnospiraceae bacterium]
MKKKIGTIVFALTAAVAIGACGNAGSQEKEGWEQPTQAAVESAPADMSVATDSSAAQVPSKAPDQAGTESICLIIPTEVGSSAQEEAVVMNAAKEAGYTVTVKTTEGDPAKQTAAFDEAIEANAAVIICDNADGDATAASVQKAKEKGIPTILMNRGIDANGGAAAQILTDRKTCIVKLAETFADQVGKTGRYAFLYTAGDPVHEEEIKAFADALASYESMTEASRTEADEFNVEAIKETIRHLLTEDSGINALICANGAQAKAAADIVEETGAELTIVCLDGNDEISTLILSGRIFASIVKPAEDLAGTAMKVAEEYLKNGQISTNGTMYFAGLILTPRETILVVSPTPSVATTPSPVPSGKAESDKASQAASDEDGDESPVVVDLDGNAEAGQDDEVEAGDAEDEGEGNFDVITPDFDYEEGELNPEGMEGRPDTE